MKRQTENPLRLVCLAVFAVLGVIASVPDEAHAQDSDAHRVYHACYVPRTGAVYVIEEPGMAEACRSDKHVTFSFTYTDGHSLDAADGVPTDALYVDNQGDVGIGTVSPQSRLDIVAEANTRAFRVMRTAGDSVLNLHVFSDGSGLISLSGQSGTSVAIAGNGNSYFTGGNVGIGTNSPSEALTVAGTIESTLGGFKFPDGTVQTSAAAVTGWEHVTEDFELLGHDHRAVLVWCPEGKVVMGGGFNVPREVQVTASMPGTGHGPPIDSQQWYVHVYNPTDYTHTVTAYAVCVNGSAP